MLLCSAAFKNFGSMQIRTPCPAGFCTTSKALTRLVGSVTGVLHRSQQVGLILLLPAPSLLRAIAVKAFELARLWGSTVKLTSPSIQPKDPSNKSGYLANTSAGVRPLGGVVSCAAQMFSSIIRSKSRRQATCVNAQDWFLPLCYV